MPRPRLEDVVGRWSKLVENFSTSTKDFYSSIEAALEPRKIPGIKTSRVDWHEGGVLSPQREYLRVTGDEHVFDICAAPFGTGFFFSWWVVRRRARLVVLYFLGVLLATAVVWRVLDGLMSWLRGSTQLGHDLVRFLQQAYIDRPFVLLPLSFLIVLWLVAIVARAGRRGPELAMLAVPILGWFYRAVFASETYYRLDTMLMFQAAVGAAVNDAVNGLLTKGGLRSLTEDEAKPILRDFTAR